VFVSKAHADAMTQLSQSQVETSKIESNLQVVKTQKEQLATEVQQKDARIQQLEEENSELKE